jgi:raffinose/stachyose/melibiose transport system permease protein
MYVLFVVYPLIKSVQYSFYKWNGIGKATWVGGDNYVKVFTEPENLGAILNSFKLMFFFVVLPVAGGLILAALIRGITSGPWAVVARVALFLPVIIPAAGAAVTWNWMYSENGVVNQVLTAVGLGDLTRPWLADFTWALPALGLIGTWIITGLCTMLFLSGIGRIDGSLYEAARIDGAGWFREFRAVTLPGLRTEIGVCVTLTMILALASFDVVYNSTNGGPGGTTMVPGLQVYQLAFTERKIGLASALSLVLALMIWLLILPIQRWTRAER